MNGDFPASVQFTSIHFDYLPSRPEGRPAIYVETRRDNQAVKIGQLVKLVIRKDDAGYSPNDVVPIPNPYFSNKGDQFSRKTGGLDWIEIDEMVIEDIDGIRIVLANGPTSTGCKNCQCTNCSCGLSCSCRQKGKRWGYQLFGDLVTVSRPIVKTAYDIRAEKYGYTDGCGYGTMPNVILPLPPNTRI